MQFNRYIALPKSSLFNHKLFFIFRLAMFGIIAVYLWQMVVANQKLLLDLGSVNVRWHAYEFFLLLLTFILLPVNWLLEALKWQVIAAAANLSLRQAIKGVVLGLTLDNVLPLGTGAISGRIISLPDEHRIRLIPGVLAGQIMQSLITLVFGLYGFWLVWSKASSLFLWQPINTFFVLGIIVVIALAGIFWQSKIGKFLAPLWHYSIRSWRIIFGYSFLRYLIFLAQFMILSVIFTSEIETTLVFACATWVFAAKTFMPKISNLEKLGIRALAVVFFMNLFGLPVTGMLMTVIILWFINLAIPSIVGLVLLKELKTDSQMK